MVPWQKLKEEKREQVYSFLSSAIRIRSMRSPLSVHIALRDQALCAGHRLSMTLCSFSFTWLAVDSSLGLPTTESILAASTAETTERPSCS